MRHRLLLILGLPVVTIAVIALVVSRSAAPPPDEPRAAAPVATSPAEAPPAAAVQPPRAPAPRVTPQPAPPRPAPEPAPAAPVAVAPTLGTLRIETDVPGATVFLDRIGVGEAPLTIPDIAPGPHRLNVSASGYDGYGETIDVAPGERVITISFKEIKLDARLDAVHKHGMGSCRGMLTATPAGIRFAAADGGDSFTVAFNAVETFEVDYLAKNLRLKVRQGRTYNFGDPDGDADRLFVFHRDVDKVRERVLSGG